VSSPFTASVFSPPHHPSTTAFIQSNRIMPRNCFSRRPNPSIKSKPICLPGSGRGPVVQCARRSQPHPGWEQCEDAHLPCCVCLAEEVEHHDAGWPERSMCCIHSDRG
jgi:hypothetical protein